MALLHSFNIFLLFCCRFIHIFRYNGIGILIEHLNIPKVFNTVTGEGDPAIDALVMQRYEAKKAKNFAEADRIRDELKAQGIEITDVPGGAKWKRV